MPHIHDDIDFTVSAYIVHPDKNRVLLVHVKRYDLWLPVGGHVELNEDTDEALMREIKEECGLEVTILAERIGFSDDLHKPLLRPEAVDIIDKVNEVGHRHLDLKFFAFATSSEPVLEEKSHHEVRWFSVDELSNPPFFIQEDVKWFGLRAIEKCNMAIKSA